MSILYAFFFILVASINSAPVQGQGDTSKVAVTLYYETLCPFSQEFITDELAPTFLDSHYGRLFKEIHLVPFGIAEMINTTAHEYACQHDEAECQGNRFHACAIKHIEDKKSLVKYISCLAETVEVDTEEEEDYPVDKCLDKVPDGLYPKIMECYNSEEGWNLLAEHGTRTKKFFSGSGEEFVPYVSFNNKKDDDLAEEAIKDLEKVMCQLTGLEHSGSLEESEDEDEEF